MTIVQQDKVGEVFVSTISLNALAVKLFDPLIRGLERAFGGTGVAAADSKGMEYETIVFALDEDGEPDMGVEVEHAHYMSEEDARVGHRLLVEKYLVEPTDEEVTRAGPVADQPGSLGENDWRL